MVFFRFMGFCSSIALINYYQLYNKTNHINRFQEHITSLNPVALEKLEIYKRALLAKGASTGQASKIAQGLLGKSIEIQAQLKSAIDYYKVISALLIVVILIIALIPYINRTIVNLKTKQPAPISY
ncbi:hypothetical protein [Pedobacter steynii]